MSELIQSDLFKRPTRHERAIIIGSRKLILGVDGEKTFFEHGADPGERQPFSPSGPERQDLERALEEVVGRMGEFSEGMNVDFTSGDDADSVSHVQLFSFRNPASSSRRIE